MDNFILSRVGEVKGFLDTIESTLKENHAVMAEHPEHLKQAVLKLPESLKKIREFVNLNRTAVSKMLKKHDKKAPTDRRLLKRLKQMEEKDDNRGFKLRDDGPLVARFCHEKRVEEMLSPVEKRVKDACKEIVHP